MVQQRMNAESTKMTYACFFQNDVPFKIKLRIKQFVAKLKLILCRSFCVQKHILQTS